MRPHLLISPAAAAFVAFLASPVAAGPLSQVAHGVENKVETHQDPPSPPSRPDPPSTPDPPSHGDNDSHTGDGYGQPSGYYRSGDTVYYMTPPCDDCGAVSVVVAGGSDDEPGGPFLDGPARLDLYIGGHSVVGSQGALVGDLRASKGWLGLSASGTSYFEDVEGKRGDETVRLDLMALAVNGRVIDAGPTEVWLDGGLAASSSTEYETILGGVVGLRAEHHLQPNLSLVAQGRVYRLEADVSAVEGWAGVRAWFLGAGYRVLRFNVGPPLHGPEAGLAFSF
ncbi:MAG TPA: hypothetical protein VK698_38905 [Kofleriaceae bacterium]|nr:hypothetical protein [Kofleriaceae bacterium]